MKSQSGVVTVTLFVLLVPWSLASGAFPPRERLSFNAGWRFHKVEAGEAAADLAPADPAFNDSSWRALDLPHDWAIEGPFVTSVPNSIGMLPSAGVGWYRKRFDCAASDRNRRVFLDIDGAMSHAQVWLNGRLLGEWPYGYSSFRFELTSYLRFGGANLLAIRLDNPPKSSRWYPGGGIYRNVWLVKTALVHVAHWGVFVTTPHVSRDKATIEIRTTIENGSSSPVTVSVEQQVFEESAPTRTVTRTEGSPVSVNIGGSAESLIRLDVASPKLWEPLVATSAGLSSARLLTAAASGSGGNLYRVRTTVRAGGRILDQTETRFGIRRIVIHPERGLEVNGRRVRLNGVCLHHDLGPLGAAVNVRALERQLELLAEMGCNAIRTAHNPPAPELLDLCDRMGFLVVAEAFDTWRYPAREWVPNDYSRHFDKWHKRDIRAFVRRDRNHPSIFMWSSGNEIQDQRKPDGLETARKLLALFHEEDPTRPVTGGLDDPSVIKNRFYQGFDVIGLNYKPHLYAETRKLAPGYPLFGSETASTVSSRGEYFFPVEPKIGDGADVFQVTSYDLYFPTWASTPDTEFAAQDDNPSVLGEFVWSGFDYLGEPTPFDPTRYLSYNKDPEDRRRIVAATEKNGGFAPARSSYFGILDLCGFKKDRFYLYQARWRPELPMAHILPHWTWPERVGQVTPVYVYTSGDEAELFLNGRSLGLKKKGPREYRLKWDGVVYEPGELKVVARKAGREWATELVRTAGTAASVALEADRNDLRANGRDLAFVTVSVRDQAGAIVPRSSDRIRFRLEGPGQIAGVDNGDPTRLESFQAKDCRVFNGLCLVIVRSVAGRSGPVVLYAEADGLRPARIRLRNR
ncbi:MAG: beta-galactosidase GalB [Acidobacteriota bacterium]